MAGLKIFLTDGTVEMDSNIMERSIRPVALSRKNALFAGHDEGGKNLARIASLIETSKLKRRRALRVSKDYTRSHRSRSPCGTHR